MKPGDIFANHMQVCRPICVEFYFVFAITNCSDVIKQGIKPDINGKFWIERKGYAPCLARACDVHIFKLGLNQSKDFIASAFGLDKIWVLFIEGKQLIAEFGKGKEIAGLQAFDCRSFVAGADLLFVEFFFGFECFASFAIPSFITTFINEPVVKNFLSEGLTALVMSGFAGLNEIIEANIKGTPNFFELVCHFVAIGLGIKIKFCSSASDFNGVFVVTHEKENIFALHALEASLNISANLSKAVPI